MSTNTALSFLPEEKQPQETAVQNFNTAPNPLKAPRERIKIVGVGGGGNNALNHIIRSGVTGVEFLAVNTDQRSLDMTLTEERLVLGPKTTSGHGAGAKPEVGELAAVESREEIRKLLKDCDMVYFAAGMGGGTGTGALPVIARIAKELGILTVSVVTKPFSFEGRKRFSAAMEGIEKLEEIVDALIVVPNDRLLQLSERNTAIGDAFAMADEVLRQAIQGVTDLVMRPGNINVDFADLRTVMSQAGSAVMGIGLAKGESRAREALKMAMESPLMETSMRGAKGVLFNVTGGSDIAIMEVEEAAQELQKNIAPDANFVWGWVHDENMKDSIQMVVIATGFDKDTAQSFTVSQKEPSYAQVRTSKDARQPRSSGSSVKPEDFNMPDDLFKGNAEELDIPTYFRKNTKKI